MPSHIYLHHPWLFNFGPVERDKKSVQINDTTGSSTKYCYLERVPFASMAEAKKLQIFFITHDSQGPPT
jgi:hypothetical protein